MLLRRLRLVNFRQHRDTEIELGPGITGIIGPNGAGKTTLLEAIAWALYGLDATRGSRDTLRWRRAPARAEVRVELEFALGAHEYRVVRTLFNAELYVDGSLGPVASSLREVTAHVGRTLGMSHEEFRHTYFTGQRELSALGTLKPAERRRFLNRLLGYERLQLAQRLVRDRRNAMQSELAGLQHGAPDPREVAAQREQRAAEVAAAVRLLEEREELYAAAQAASDRFLPAFRELKEFRERHQALTAERRLAEERLRQAVDLVGRLQSQHTAAEAARVELEGLRAQLDAYRQARAELEEHERLSRDAEARSRIEAKLDEVAKQEAELARRLEAAREAAARARAVAERLEQVRSEREQAELAHQERHARWVREKADADASRRALLEQFRDLEAQRDRIEKAGPQGACPTCGRPLGAEYSGVLELLAQQLEDVKQTGQYYRAKIDQLSVEPVEVAELRARMEAAKEAFEANAQELAVAKAAADEAIGLEKQLQRLAERRRALEDERAALSGVYDRAAHEAVRRRVAELEPAARRGERLAGDAERAGALALELVAAERNRADQIEAVARLSRELDGLRFDEEAFLRAEREMERLEREWRDAEREVAVARAELAAAQGRLREAELREAEATARARRAAEIQESVRLHSELDRALGDLSADLNAELGPEIAGLAGEFLGVLTDGQYDEVVLDDAFEATVLEDGEPQPVLSGGEEDLRDLVLRLAVSQMIADRSGQPLSMLVLDEIFGALDETRRANVMHLLRALAGRFPQVVVITHIESVREALDRVLRVRFDEASGAAVVTEEGLPPLPGGADADVAA
ncbi:MAG TPA: SMC family ATPase [Gemmatimonadales bacterium]|nr:SMC family ATPase [Gemmatimonadales bacterium]